MTMHTHGSHDAAHAPHSTHGTRGDYLRFLLMIALSFVAMFFLMYAMIDRADNLFVNWNQVYMAGMMVGAMVILEIGLMFTMYPNRTLNLTILAAGVAVLALGWTFT